MKKTKALKEEDKVLITDIKNALKETGDEKLLTGKEYNQRLLAEYLGRAEKETVDTFAATLFSLCKQVEGGWLIPDEVANSLSDSMATSYEELHKK